MTDRRTTWESWIEQALAGPNLHEPPKGTLHRAIALGTRLARRPSAAGWLLELLFDSMSQPLPAGVRTAAAGPRRLLYRATSPGPPEVAFQVDLRVRREKRGTVEITGQLLPCWPSARAVAAVGRTVRNQDLGASGEFLFRRLPGRAASLLLELHGPEGEVLALPPIALDDSSAGDV